MKAYILIFNFILPVEELPKIPMVISNRIFTSKIECEKVAVKINDELVQCIQMEIVK